MGATTPIDPLAVACHTMNMEVTANSSGSVHVLRHSFRPSDYLALALERYLEPGATRPRPLLYATRLVTFDTLHYPIEEINIDYDFANRAFMRQHREKIALGGASVKGARIAVHSQADGSLRVGFLPANEERFNELLSGFDRFPLREEPAEPEVKHRHYVHTTIPANLLDVGAIEEVTRSFSRELDDPYLSRFYTISPSAIDRRAIPLPTVLPGVVRPE